MVNKDNVDKLTITRNNFARDAADYLVKASKEQDVDKKAIWMELAIDSALMYKPLADEIHNWVYGITH